MYIEIRKAWERNTGTGHAGKAPPLRPEGPKSTSRLPVKRSYAFGISRAPQRARLGAMRPSDCGGASEQEVIC